MTYWILAGTAGALSLLTVALFLARRQLTADTHRALILRYAGEADAALPAAMVGRLPRISGSLPALDVRRLQDWLSGMLELADLQMPARRALLLAVAADAVLVTAFQLWLGSFLLAQSWALIVIFGGTAQYVHTRQRRRRLTFEKALPDFLMMLASSLRAGLSLQRGIEAVSSEGDGEVERQLRRASTEMAMGMQPDAALAEVADRMHSQDMHWVVVAIGIQRRVGGNLASVLDLVADTIRGRETIRQEVRAVSSEGRMSANVLVALPIGVFLMLYVTRREYVEVLWLDPTGRALLFTTFALIALGMTWVRSMVSME